MMGDHELAAWPVAAPPGPAPGVEWARFGRRLGAYLIDGLIFGAVWIAVLALGGAFHETLDTTGSFTFTTTVNGETKHYLLQSWAYGAGAALVFAYFALQWAAWGCTLGQRLLRLRIVRAADGGPVPPLNCAIRAAVFAAPTLLGLIAPGLSTAASLVVLLACLAVLWDKQRRGWHDHLAGTAVIHPVATPAYPPAAYPPPVDAYPGYPPPPGSAVPGYAAPPPDDAPPPAYGPPPGKEPPAPTDRAAQPLTRGTEAASRRRPGRRGS